MTRSKLLRLLLLAVLSTAALADDETDFSAAPPASWQRVDPLSRATFDFSQGTAHLTSTAPSLAEAQVLGPARAALLAPATFEQCAVVADLLPGRPPPIAPWTASSWASSPACKVSPASAKPVATA